MAKTGNSTMSALSRRELLGAGVAVGSALALPNEAAAKTIAQEIPWSAGEADRPSPVAGGPYQFLDSNEAAWLDAAVARLIPEDDLGPGAKELGVTFFIDRQLAGPYGKAERWYMSGPWPKGTETQGYQSRMNPAQLYRAAIKTIDAHCAGEFEGKPFAQLGANDQDNVLSQLEEGKIKLGSVDAKSFFKQLLLNVQEGFFADPMYGGNKDMLAWKMIGFPGARYDYRDWVKRHGERYPLPPVSIYGRPEWNKRG